MLLTLAAAVLVLGVLIFVHELGHFLAAKAVDVAVPRFSIGFGPPTPIRFRRGETEYLVSWIPFGGYVKMASLEEQQAMESLEGGALEQEFPRERLFESKPLWARILVISAGVIMNALFAWAAYSGLFLAYGRAEDPTTAIARVDAEMLPEAAGALAEVPFGARVTRINGRPVDSWDDILDGVLDPTTDRLRFEFAAAEAIEIDAPGADADLRGRIYAALVPLWEPRIGTVLPGRPADDAGIEVGDLIARAHGEPLASWDDLVTAVEASVGEPLELEVERDGRTVEITVTPAEEEIQGPGGEARKVGRIGVGPQRDLKRIRLGLAAALAAGAEETWENGLRVLVFLKGLIVGQVSARQLGGPVLIAQASGQFARAGIAALIGFMAFLSINLAILNLLPIPVLDGGHLVFLLLEGLRGRPLPQALRMRLTQAGVFVLLGIMVFAVINDLLR